MKTTIYILIIFISLGLIGCKKEIIKNPNLTENSSSSIQKKFNKNIKVPFDSLNVVIKKTRNLELQSEVFIGNDPNPGDTTGNGSGDDWLKIKHAEITKNKTAFDK